MEQVKEKIQNKNASSIMVVSTFPMKWLEDTLNLNSPTLSIPCLSVGRMAWEDDLVDITGLTSRIHETWLLGYRTGLNQATNEVPKWQRLEWNRLGRPR